MGKKPQQPKKLLQPKAKQPKFGSNAGPIGENKAGDVAMGESSSLPAIKTAPTKIFRDKINKGKGRIVKKVFVKPEKKPDGMKTDGMHSEEGAGPDTDAILSTQGAQNKHAWRRARQEAQRLAKERKQSERARHEVYWTMK